MEKAAASFYKRLQSDHTRGIAVLEEVARSYNGKCDPEMVSDNNKKGNVYSYAAPFIE